MCNFFPIFGHQNLGSGSGSGSRSGSGRIETNADPQHWYRLNFADPELTLLYHCYQGLCGSASVTCASGSSILFLMRIRIQLFYFYADPAGSGFCSCSLSKRYESATAGLQTQMRIRIQISEIFLIRDPGWKNSDPFFFGINIPGSVTLDIPYPVPVQD
jgi:hypothetical protein